MRERPFLLKPPPDLLEDQPEVERCKAILKSLAGNRELLLEAVLDGPFNFRVKCQRLFRGLRVTDKMIALMWGYISFRKGPNPRYEYEMLVLKREAMEEQTRKEKRYLDELYALSHGKNHEEEEAKILKATPAPESARLAPLPTAL